MAKGSKAESQNGASTPVQSDRFEGGAVRLGKRYCTWKPGGMPITGFLFGISGMRLTEGGVAETLIIKTTQPTDAYDWDKEKKEAIRRDSLPGEELAVFLTAGLESLRASATETDGIHMVYIPSGKKIKIKGGKTFWQYVSDDSSDTETLEVSVKKWKRTPATMVQRVVARADEGTDVNERAPAPAPEPGAPGYPEEEGLDEIPF